MTLSLEVVQPEAWPSWVAGELAERLRVRPKLRLVLPTGETPAPVYAALVDLVGQGRASLAEAHVILLDEYLGLPPDDPALGGPRLRRELLRRCGLPLPRVRPPSSPFSPPFPVRSAPPSRSGFP